MDNLTEIFTRLETPFQIDLSELDKSVSKLDIGHYTEAQLDLADSWMKAMKNSTTELLVKTPGFDKVLLLDTLCEMYRRRHPDSSSSDSKIAEFIRLHPYRTQQDSVRVKGWGRFATKMRAHHGIRLAHCYTYEQLLKYVQIPSSL